MEVIPSTSNLTSLSPGNKNIKIIKKLNNSYSIENLPNHTTFFNLKEYAKNLNKDNIGLFYNDREIEINADDLTINEIFSENNNKNYSNNSEIIIEIKSKNFQHISENKNLLNFFHNILNYDDALFSPCDEHKREFCKFYCDNCKASICFRCSITKNHINHNIYQKFNSFQTEFNSLNECYENLLNSVKKDHSISSIDKVEFIKNEHIEQINKDFELILQSVNNIKSYYIQFYIDYYETYFKKADYLKEELDMIIERFKNVSCQFSMKNEIFSQNLEKMNEVENEIKYSLKIYKNYSDFSKLKNELNIDYYKNLNAIFHKLENIKIEYFNEEKIKVYKSFTSDFYNNEEVLLEKYLQELYKSFDNKNNSIISLPIPITKKILLYNFDKQEFNSVYIKNTLTSFKFYDYSRYVNKGDFIFICGGLENERELSSSYLCNIKDLKVLSTARMNKCRSQHSLVINNLVGIKLIFAVSGFNNPSIEIFNPNLNKWFNFASLKKAICNANILFVDDNKYMYVFGGNEFEFERIFIGDISSVKFDKNFIYNYSFESGSFLVEHNLYSDFEAEINLNYSGFGIIKINPNKFFICGGFNIENDAPSTDEIRVFEYNKNKNNFEVKIFNQNLPVHSCFYNQVFTHINENILAQFTASGFLLTFNKMNNQFNSIYFNLNI